MIRAKRAKKLFYTDVVESINLINYNRARFIVYNINNTFRIYFKECIKEKEEISKIFYIWTVYFENYIRYSV